jgi:hypothetical protein
MKVLFQDVQMLGELSYGILKEKFIKNIFMKHKRIKMYPAFK